MITLQPHYQRTKQGDWIVCGPANIIKLGRTVTVYKRDGSTRIESIERVGKPFLAQGVTMVYGHPQPRERRPSLPRVPAYERCRACGGSGSVEQELGECAACRRDFDA